MIIQLTEFLLFYNVLNEYFLFEIITLLILVLNE
jgi:hypothetical protein